MSKLPNDDETFDDVEIDPIGVESLEEGAIEEQPSTQQLAATGCQEQPATVKPTKSKFTSELDAEVADIKEWLAETEEQVTQGKSAKSRVTTKLDMDVADIKEMLADVSSIEETPEALVTPPKVATQSTRRKLASGKTAALARVKKASQSAEKAGLLPAKLKLRDRIILSGFLVLVVWILTYVLRSGPNKVEVKLVIPQDQAVVSRQVLAMDWRAVGDQFRFQIEENGQKVIERITKETHYTFRPDELELFKPEHRYRWRVIPLNYRGEELPYIVTDFQFKISPAFGKQE